MYRNEMNCLINELGDFFLSLLQLLLAQSPLFFYFFLMFVLVFQTELVFQTYFVVLRRPEKKVEEGKRHKNKP